MPSSAIELVPIKFGPEAHRAVRHGAILYDESQWRFAERVVAYYFRENAAEIDAKTEEFFEAGRVATLALKKINS